MLTSCGVICSSECGLYQKECPGCHEIGGKVFWAQDYGGDLCPIYECAQEKELKNCGYCSRVPCRLWFSTRDPSLEEEEFNGQIARRLANLEKDWTG